MSVLFSLLREIRSCGCRCAGATEQYKTSPPSSFDFISIIASVLCPPKGVADNTYARSCSSVSKTETQPLMSGTILLLRTSNEVANTLGMTLPVSLLSAPWKYFETLSISEYVLLAAPLAQLVCIKLRFLTAYSFSCSTPESAFL